MSLLEIKAVVREAFKIDPGKLTYRRAIRLSRDGMRLLRTMRGEIDEREEMLRSVGVF